MKGEWTKNEYLNFSFIIPKKGIRFLKAKVVKGKSPRILFERDGFKLYVAGNDELRVAIPNAPLYPRRRLRRFLRDYSKSQGGLPRTTNWYFSCFK